MSPAEHKYLLAQDAFSKRHIPACLDLLKQAELLGHPPDKCSACRWNCWMLLGDFENAWLESDAIACRGNRDPNRLWDGLPFAGNRVMIRCLHGLGDTIQFLRYAKLLRREAAAVWVQAPAQMSSLLRAMPDVDCVTTWSDGPGLRGRDWDQQIEIMELPHAFRTTLATIPDDAPYLSVPEPYLYASRRALGPKQRPRIGLMWESGAWNPTRNLAASDLLPLYELTEMEFYSFQRGPAREQLKLLGRRTDIRDLSGTSPDVLCFAADLTQMDLLITVDTLAAHLAGALAIPAWVLLPYEADWRWMLNRRDSPWYPTMRLFRQEAPGNWGPPVREIAEALSRFHPFDRHSHPFD